MSAFKGRPQRDQKKMDEFAEGADVSTNTENVGQEKKKKPTQEPFYTTLNPEFLEAIKVIAWHERISQREVIERAISGTFDLSGANYQNMRNKYIENN